MNRYPYVDFSNHYDYGWAMMTYFGETRFRDTVFFARVGFGVTKENGYKLIRERIRREIFKFINKR